MNKIVFINATAASEGGALTTIEQFLKRIPKNNDMVFYIFCSLKELKKYENKSIKIINNIKGKKWFDRIMWDLWGLKNWSKKQGITADLIISFQNTGVNYNKNIKQIIILNQSIPFTKEVDWNFLNSNERLLWFYKNIYKKIIKYSMKGSFCVVVPTEWLKRAVMQQFNWDSSRVLVIKPILEQIEVKDIPKIDFKDDRFHMFYPANTAIYKNHELLINALRYIKDYKPEIYNNLIIHFTFSGDLRINRTTELIGLAEKLQVIEHIIFLPGKISYERILSFYKSCNLVVFPSYIESFPLPLIEAATFGLPILASDLDYAKEVIGGYKGAKFLDYKDSKLWAENIIDLYNKKIKYTPYNINYETSRKDFFKLVKKLIV